MFPSPVGAQSTPPDQARSSQGQAKNPSTDQNDETIAMQEEVAEQDVTYLKSRLVYRYDFKSLTGDANSNRFRLKSLFAFGPQKRLAVAITIPVVYKNVPGDSAGGLSDVEAQFGGVIQRWERFRHGAAVEFALQTSTDKLLGGGTTTIKPAWGFTAILTRRMELNCVFNYKRSIHTSRGTPKNEFEPDCTLSTRRLGMTWFGEWDSYYLLAPGQLAQTLKVGAGRRLGNEHRWVVRPYYSFPLNGPGRQTQYIHNVGVDVSWYLARQK
jgi:hypothetical protein